MARLLPGPRDYLGFNALVSTTTPYIGSNENEHILGLMGHSHAAANCGDHVRVVLEEDGEAWFSSELGFFWKKGQRPAVKFSALFPGRRQEAQQIRTKTGPSLGNAMTLLTLEKYDISLATQD
jgi:hypothetical protein